MRCNSESRVTLEAGKASALRCHLKDEGRHDIRNHDLEIDTGDWLPKYLHMVHFTKLSMAIYIQHTLHSCAWRQDHSIIDTTYCVHCNMYTVLYSTMSRAHLKVSNCFFDVLHIGKAQGSLNAQRQNSVCCLTLQVLMHIPAGQVKSITGPTGWTQLIIRT